jgi:hypothetical protein
MSRLSLAIEQLEFARKCSLRLLDHVKEEDWFRQPPGGVSHITWQVGHLAIDALGTSGTEFVRRISALDLVSHAIAHPRPDTQTSRNKGFKCCSRSVSHDPVRYGTSMAGVVLAGLSLPHCGASGKTPPNEPVGPRNLQP